MSKPATEVSLIGLLVGFCLLTVALCFVDWRLGVAFCGLFCMRLAGWHWITPRRRRNDNGEG